ncbi:hypothetical protein Ddye_006816 [Dipteronia dyeriana]|uniref:Uncharacterized protein n=1 Tax=Dipteronia dyeriana TaxID=168575 RepID=A0AAE0CRI9_9ROSI|nr:hypothetical protein Ddye_006816 [Dipteronia dyeriana]
MSVETLTHHNINYLIIIHLLQRYFQAMASDEEHLCQKYLFLKPKEATLFDLIRLLYSSNLEETRFVEFSDQADRHINNFRRRWLIFISVVAQKVLLVMRIPLTVVGYVL